MLSWNLFIIGCLLIALSMVDVLWSTVSTRGGGPVAMRVASTCWWSLRWLSSVFPNSRIQEFNSVAVLVLTFLAWVLPMWVGWTLIFSAPVDIIIDLGSEEPAGLVDRAYFAGMIFLTLGTGDFIATTPGWRLLTIAAAINGLAVITLTITYLISVLSAAIDKRHLGASVLALGKSPRQMLLNGWDERGFAPLEDALRPLGRELMLHAEQHLAYPVLQYFHATEDRVSLLESVAVLEDATTLLSEAVEPQARASEVTICALRRAVDHYLRRVALAQAEDVINPPPLPDLDEARSRGLPLVDDAAIKRAFDQRQQTRRALLGLITASGRQWPTKGATGVF